MKKLIYIFFVSGILMACGNDATTNHDDGEAYPVSGDTGNAGTSGAGNANGLDSSNMDRLGAEDTASMPSNTGARPDSTGADSTP